MEHTEFCKAISMLSPGAKSYNGLLDNLFQNYLWNDPLTGIQHRRNFYFSRKIVFYAAQIFLHWYHLLRIKQKFATFRHFCLFFHFPPSL